MRLLCLNCQKYCNLVNYINTVIVNYINTVKVNHINILVIKYINTAIDTVNIMNIVVLTI